jgi:hypothetical protein
MGKIINECLHKEKCNKIVFENNQYLNIFALPCKFLHPNESMTNWTIRNTFKKVEKPK